MKIGINAYEANVPNRVGSNEFAYQVLIRLEKLAVDHEVVVYLPSQPLADLPKSRPGWEYRVIPPGRLWTIWRLPLELYVGKSKRPDVFLSLGHYAPRFSPVPSVVCIMDLAYLLFPQFFRKSDVLKLKRWTGYSVRNAAHIITISENTKRDILRHYHVSEEKITVAYPGYEPLSLVGSPQRLLKKLKIEEPYILYVGTMQPRKNLVRLVKAFEILSKGTLHKNFRLVLAGKVGWLSDELIHGVQKSPLRRKIQLLGFVTPEEKIALYSRAKISILPGLYEGFGIPALESLQAGTLPVVSNTASLPEVVGDAGILVDPYSVEDIARGMSEGLQYTSRQIEEFKIRARKQLSKFSWEKTALQTLEVLLHVRREE